MGAAGLAGPIAFAGRSSGVSFAWAWAAGRTERSHHHAAAAHRGSICSDRTARSTPVGVPAATPGDMRCHSRIHPTINDPMATLSSVNRLSPVRNEGMNKGLSVDRNKESVRRLRPCNPRKFDRPLGGGQHRVFAPRVQDAVVFHNRPRTRENPGMEGDNAPPFDRRSAVSAIVPGPVI